MLYRNKLGTKNPQLLSDFEDPKGKFISECLRKLGLKLGDFYQIINCLNLGHCSVKKYHHSQFSSLFFLLISFTKWKIALLCIVEYSFPFLPERKIGFNYINLHQYNVKIDPGRKT